MKNLKEIKDMLIYADEIVEWSMFDYWIDICEKYNIAEEDFAPISESIYNLFNTIERARELSVDSLKDREVHRLTNNFIKEIEDLNDTWI